MPTYKVKVREEVAVQYHEFIVEAEDEDYAQDEAIEMAKKESFNWDAYFDIDDWEEVDVEEE